MELLKRKKQGKQEQENLTISHAFREGLDFAMIAKITGLRDTEVTKRLITFGLIPKE